MDKCLANLKQMPLGHRLTNQRKMILDYLRCVKTHPTAKIIYKELKKKLPQISFATIYRNLNFLEEKGFILALKSMNGCVHYDGNASSHPHFICEKCGRVMDLDSCDCQDLLKVGKKVKQGKIEDYRLNFYGTCCKCQKIKKVN